MQCVLCGNFIIMSVLLVVKYYDRHSGCGPAAVHPYRDDQSTVEMLAPASYWAAAAADAYTPSVQSSRPAIKMRAGDMRCPLYWVVFMRLCILDLFLV